MNNISGEIAVLLALMIAAVGSSVAMAAGFLKQSALLRWARLAMYGYALLMFAANAIMVKALIEHDFSVSYVAQVGSLQTPLLYTIVSLWSSLEGSILFWGAILGFYAIFLTFQTRHLQRQEIAYTFGVFLAIASFFAFLIAGPACPFEPVSPVPSDGPGPNPLLQNHPLMVIHPPMLYLGYVGLTVPFSLALGALLAGRLQAVMAQLLRQWVLIPWMFLSVGIVLGGWWAYEVLGWGGYWAWDPVENASFLPWLAATSYLHASIVQQRRGLLGAWSLTLVVGAYLLTILGTFMTRSGVFNSVHSFTQSPIGPVFLVFLGILLLLSVFLLLWRAPLLDKQSSAANHALLSRETAFLLNNAVLVVLTLTVLLGTIFPLVTEAIKGSKVSVGEPYYNTMAAPLALLLVFLMGAGPLLPWGHVEGKEAWRSLYPGLLLGLIGAVFLALLGHRSIWLLATVFFATFALWATLLEIFGPPYRRWQRAERPLGSALWHHLHGQRRRVGGAVVHLAVLGVALGIAFSQNERQQQEASLLVGESSTLGPYRFLYQGSNSQQEPHRFAVIANFDVFDGEKLLGSWQPRLNYYPQQREPIGTPAVRTLGNTDIYISLMSLERDGSRVGMKVFLTPGVVWLWQTLPLWVLGSMLSLWPKRRLLFAVGNLQQKDDEGSLQ